MKGETENSGGKRWRGGDHRHRKGVHIGKVGTHTLKVVPKMMVIGKQKNGDIEAERKASAGRHRFVLFRNGSVVM